MHIDRIHAVDSSTLPLSMQAAMDSSDGRSVAKLLARADVILDRKLTTKELDDKLAGSALTVENRIAIKAALTRLGLLV
jgi:hypothetical protein